MIYSHKIVLGQVTAKQNLLKDESLYSSNSGIYIGDRSHQHLKDFIFTTHNVVL